MPNDVTIKLQRPHPAQTQVINEQTRFNILVCGRRWGKTELLLNRLYRPLLAGQPVGWFAPNEKYFDEVWRQANQTLAPIITRSDSQKKRLEVITGGILDFWTLHNTDDPGRGRKYAAIAIDEAAIIPSRRLARQWPEAIRPTLTDYQGDAWFASTPKGAGYFKDLFEQAATRDDWTAWQMPTIANPHINPDEVAAAKLELPRLVYEQEYEAKFVTEFGAIFKEPLRYDTPPTTGYREATGCDFAYTSKSGDYTVFLTGRLHENKLYLTNAYRRQAETNEWMHALKQCSNPFAFIGGQEKGITQLLRQQGINLKTANATTDKLARAQPAAAAWNRGDILIPSDAPWVDDVLPEILAFTGNNQVDEHDDTIDALSSLHYALHQQPQPRARIL